MTLVIQSLQLVGRGLLRAYASDLAYEGAVLLAIGLVALTLTLAVMQHAPPAVSAPAESIRLCWEADPICW